MAVAAGWRGASAGRGQLAEEDEREGVGDGAGEEDEGRQVGEEEIEAADVLVIRCEFTVHM